MVYHLLMSREDPQMKIRLPADLKDQIEAASKNSGRSMNAEIVARLEASFHLYGSGAASMQLIGEHQSQPTADDIADKVVERISRQKQLVVLDSFTKDLEQRVADRFREHWQREFGYDPNTPQAPQHGGPPKKSQNARKPLK